MTSFKLTWRFKTVIGIIGIFSLMILFRYGMIMLGGSEIGISSQIAMPAVERGPILDRNGRILAIQTKLYSVSAWIPNISRPQETSRILAEALDMDPDKLLERIRANTGFIFIKRKVTPTESTRVQELINEGKVDGVSLQPEFGRNYPGKTLASHLIGYVGTDNIGLDGLEYTFNQELSPPVIGEDVGMVYGNQVFLTIDIAVQHALEKIAENTLKSNKADSIMILVMEAKTGDVLGYASYPNYDPNSFETLTPATMRNKPISLLYEPGSVFKVFSVASFLETGSVSPSQEFYCNGHYEYTYPDGRTFRIGCLGTHGNVDAEHILKYSCNAGAAYASELISNDVFSQMLRLFGFGSATGIPLNGEEKGMLRPIREWSPRSKPTIAIGQEISVTAMQVMKAATTFANEGVLLEPHVVKKIVSPDGKLIKEYGREPIRQIISPATARNILNYMESVTLEKGTATRAAIPGIRVSAKTGTAQIIDPRTGKYSSTTFVASCLALFPTDAPEVIVYVVIESPQGDSYYGGRVAAPVVREAGEFLASYLGIPRAGQTEIRHSGRITLPRISLPEIGKTMPDFTGLPKKVLLPLLGRDDMKVVIQGSGWVYRQSPPAGSAITKGMTVVLELR